MNYKTNTLKVSSRVKGPAILFILNILKTKKHEQFQHGLVQTRTSKITN